MSTHLDRPHLDPRSLDRRPGSPATAERWRHALAAVAVLACLPYVTLKIAWLTGSTIGLNDLSLATSPVMVVANTLTLAMEASAIALAVALAGPLRHRLPGLVIGVPMFVASGLLGGILVALPLRGLLALATPGSGAPEAPEAIESWVYAVVYSGFALLGLSLITLFALASWERWVRPGGWTERLGSLPRPHRSAVAVLHGAALAAVCTVEAVLLLDAWGGPDVMAAVAWIASMAVALGLAALARRAPGRMPAHIPLIAAFAGSAVVASWGLYSAVLLTLPNPLAAGAHVPALALALTYGRTVLGALVPLTLAALGPRQA